LEEAIEMGMVSRKGLGKKRKAEKGGLVEEAAGCMGGRSPCRGLPWAPCR
jgi:hypothetical protein